MARKIEVDLNADTSDFERGMKGAAGSVDKLEGSLKDAEQAAGKFEKGLERTDGGLDKTAFGFRGLDALASGLGTTLGIEGLDSVSSYAIGLADMADGMKDLVLPMIGKLKTAMVALNTTLLSNPIFLVIASLTALGVAFVVAYKKSETFRNIVNGAMDGIKSAVRGMWHAVSPFIELWKKEFEVLGNVVRAAVGAIRGAWNNTLGGRGISIPGVHLPGFLGGFGWDGFSFTIPALASGGPLAGGQMALVGEKGPELFVPNTGGTVVPNHALGGPTQIVVSANGNAGDKLVEILRFEVRKRGGLAATFGASA